MKQSVTKRESFWSFPWMNCRTRLWPVLNSTCKFLSLFTHLSYLVNQQCIWRENLMIARGALDHASHRTYTVEKCFSNHVLKSFICSWKTQSVARRYENKTKCNLFPNHPLSCGCRFSFDTNHTLFFFMPRKFICISF